MKHLITIILSLIFSFNICHVEAKVRVKTVYKSFNTNNQGIMREYKLYLPKGLKPNAPLIFVLHGYSGNYNLDHIGFNELADKHGIAICYPQGSKDKRGKNCWNVGYPFQDDMKVDDVKFLCDLARQIQKQYGLSRKNTFCTGMSNGGEMCYLLAYAEQKVFKAVAPVAGLTMAWMPEKYSPTRPIPLFEIHGTEDRTSEWTGDLDNKGGWGAYIAVPDAIDIWRKVNHCKESNTTPLPLKSSDSNQVTAHKYTNGKGKSQVWLYEIKGGKHTWGNKDIDTPAEIWKFFSNFVR